MPPGTHPHPRQSASGWGQQASAAGHRQDRGRVTGSRRGCGGGVSTSVRVNFGLVRFTFLKSGVGVSVGIKGADISTDPRGTYIHAGSHGFYYLLAA